MSNDREISKVLNSIGRLKLGWVCTAALAGLTISKLSKRPLGPVERWLRWGAMAACGVGIGYWKGLLS